MDGVTVSLGHYLKMWFSWYNSFHKLINTINVSILTTLIQPTPPVTVCRYCSRWPQQVQLRHLQQLHLLDQKDGKSQGPGWGALQWVPARFFSCFCEATCVLFLLYLPRVSNNPCCCPFCGQKKTPWTWTRSFTHISALLTLAGPHTESRVLSTATLIAPTRKMVKKNPGIHVCHLTHTRTVVL